MFVGEPLFIVRSNDKKEDEGVIISITYDNNSKKRKRK